MTIATGIAKQLRVAKETAFGMIAPPGTSQLLRRVTSNIDLKKATYSSKEIRPDYQISDFRHGTRSADGTISGELSVGTYGTFMASVLRNAWQATISTGPQITITAAPAGPQYTRSTGSFITDGFKIGDVVRWSGWLAPATANNATNFYITGLTALTMTGINLPSINGVNQPVVARVAGDSVTCTQAGKKTWAATSGQTNDSYTIEHWFNDIGQSEVFIGCRVADIDIKLPATGFATIDTAFMGKDIVTAQAAYFTSPTPVSTGGTLAAVNGMLFVQGVQVATVTGMNCKITGTMTTGDVVGSATRPDIFQGPMAVSGQITAYFTDNVMRDLFINETEASLQAVFTSNNTGTADFIGITLPRIKLGGASKDDGPKGLVLTMPYTALLNIYGGAAVATNYTTIGIQDSLM